MDALVLAILLGAVAASTIVAWAAWPTYRHLRKLKAGTGPKELARTQ